MERYDGRIGIKEQGENSKEKKRGDPSESRARRRQLDRLLQGGRRRKECPERDDRNQKNADLSYPDRTQGQGNGG
jgi:hypothetical protein